MFENITINWVYVVILFILGFITYRRKALDIFGSAVMIIMGIVIIFSAGANWLFLIILFLILSLLATRYSKKYKRSLGEYEGRRTSKNVISNGVVACFMAAFGGYYLPFVGGFIGAIATATADTLASEIGVLHQPRLITTFQKVDPGTDGAVSILGTVVGMAGAAIIGIVVGAVCIVGLIVGLIVYFSRKNDKDKGSGNSVDDNKEKGSGNSFDSERKGIEYKTENSLDSVNKAKDKDKGIS